MTIQERQAEGVGINKVWYLQHIDIFEGIDEDDIRQLEPTLIHRIYENKEMIFLPGDRGDKVYYLKEGLVRLARLSPGGKEITLAILEPGEVFGEMSFLDGLPRETFAEAMDRTLVCISRRKDFEKFVSSKPELGLRVTKKMGERVRDLEHQIEDLVFRDVPGRLASLILRLADKHGTEPHPKGQLIDLRLTHQEIANLIGATRESASINVSRLKQRGVVEMDKHRFVVRDRAALEEMLDEF